MGISETIVLPSLGSFLPGASGITEAICVSLQLNYTLTGGNFSASVLKGSARLPPENSVLSLPFGRLGVVKNVGSGYSSGGLVDTISGPIIPLQMSLVNFFGMATGARQSISAVAAQLGNGGVSWETMDILIKNFSFRGIALSGIQQLASSFMLADVIVRNNTIHVVDPGFPTTGSLVFTVLGSDLVSATQVTDYNSDVAAVLNPTLNAAQLDDEGDFAYDSQHAQKQPKFTVQAGAPGSQGSSDFIPIPDGWLVDGNYEEWIPPSDTDFTNPSPTPQNGRYWKVFQSPTNPKQLRGITNFKRLVKPLNLPGNVSQFVGSPITGLTKGGTGKEFKFNKDGTESGIYGFSAEKTEMFDVISNQFLEFPNALVLIPAGGGSGEASLNFFSITMEMWTFPRVKPQLFPVGDPVNPFNLPSNVVVVTPNSNVVSLSGSASSYWTKYLNNYKLINSPRLKTAVNTLFRRTMPQPGDTLIVASGLSVSNCGTIRSVSVNFGRSGVILNITAEKYQSAGGLWSGSTGGGFGSF